MSDQPKHIDARDANIGVIGDHATIHHHYPRTTQGIPLQRPPKAEHFKGRDAVLNELLPLLQPGKAVTLCGPGGMGKTALAAQAAWTLAPGKDVPDRFPDGIIFYSFYGKHSVEEAITHIVRSYDEAQQDTSFAAASRLLANKQALLILDGAEQADDLKAVLALRGGCGVLITTRSRKDAQGVRLNIKPLEDEAAAQVFREYSKVAGDDESVAGICKILGGWPVALRIAGNYVSSTEESAATYLQWLEQEPFKELAGGQHQEENAALLLRRSVDAVSADARLALGLAGYLAYMPISGSAVAIILDDDKRRARTALNELVNYGLLDRTGKRWQISHALVHTYTRTELALSKKALTRLALSKEALARLAGYYIRWCETQSAAGYARLDGERANCLRLIESCLESGLWEEVKLLVRAIDIYLDRQGHWADRLTALSMNLTAAQQAGDRRDEGVCLNILGLTCWQRGELERALAYYEQSLAIRYELGDRKGEGVTLNNMAIIYKEQGKNELALQHYQQSLTIRREVGDRQGEGTTLTNIGTLYMNQGKWETALPYLEQALPIMWEVGNKRDEGTTLSNIGSIYKAQGNHAKAIKYFEQALAIRQQLGDRAEEPVTRWNIGLCYYDMGDLAKAEEYISQAVQIAEQIGHPKLQLFREGLEWVRAARQG